MKLPLRTAASTDKYQQVLTTNRGIALGDVPVIRQWHYWKLTHNQYPYDAIFSIHDLLLPIRVVASKHRLYAPEVAELTLILKSLEKNYDGVLENFASHRSVVSHFHLHLIVYKKD